MNIKITSEKSFKKNLVKDEKQIGAVLKLGTNEAREVRGLALELRHTLVHKYFYFVIWKSQLSPIDG